jgi:hypothetical protein
MHGEHGRFFNVAHELIPRSFQPLNCFRVEGAEGGRLIANDARSIIEKPSHPLEVKGFSRAGNKTHQRRSKDKGTERGWVYGNSVKTKFRRVGK